MSKENGTAEQLKSENIETRKIPVKIYTGELVGYSPRRVAAGLEAGQGEALKRYWTALDKRGGKLKNGRLVASYADAIRHLLEQLPTIKPGK